MWRISPRFASRPGTAGSATTVRQGSPGNSRVRRAIRVRENSRTRSNCGSPVGFRAAEDLRDQVVERLASSVGLATWIVVAGHGKALPVVHGAVVALVDDLDIDCQLHLPLGHLDAIPAARSRRT